MSATAIDAEPARLKTRYIEEIRPALIERFEFSSVMQAPRLRKITLNMGVGMAKQDSKVLKAATEQLATIAGQQPSVRRARKSIAAFKLREGMPVGVAVTLRGERAYEFLDRLVSIAIPRIRDFRGLSPRSFDGRGNYTMGVREQIIFPEIDYDAIDQVRGLDITITTTAERDIEAFALLQALGMPFASQGRPKGYDPEADAAAEAEHAQAVAQAEAALAAPAPPAPANAPPAEPEPDEPEATSEPEAASELQAAGEPEAEGEAASEEPPAQQPEAPAAAEEPPAGEPEASAEAATAEDPAPEEPVAEEPEAREPVAEQAAAEAQAVEEASAEHASDTEKQQADNGEDSGEKKESGD
jgi:large subunit ribosomal protein L5